MDAAYIIIAAIAGGFCAGLASAGWWLNGYQDRINERLRNIENEVLDDTREHWVEGTQAGTKDWNWPGKSY